MLIHFILFYFYFYFFGRAMWHVGSQFPDQGSNLHPAVEAWSHNQWTTREVPTYTFFWLCWVFVAVHGLSLVAVSRGYSSLQQAGFSLWWLLLLWSTGSRHTGFSSCSTQCQQLWHAGLRVHGFQQLWCVGSVVVARGLQSAGSVVVAHELSCSAACGIFLDQGSNPCPLHWQAVS